MSTTVDKRVVEMRFDNQQFESRTKTTLGTLEKLKEALNFSRAGEGLDKLNRSVGNVKMGSLRDAVDGVRVSFSKMEAIAMTALMNITNRAIDAGIQLAKSLTIEPISQGFGEYELKMGSIQTIMASTGESLDTVNGYLEELNRYADKTIYSFSDMTSNIGKFTNAGVKLEDAVKAIQGVSNEAAVSGANANEASRAMYNFAQALSAGYVKLIDWKSIENANMATVEFKDQLLQTALAMGTVVKEGDMYRSTTTDLNGKVSQLFDSTHMFNDSLSAQWMTTDVLVQALNNYSTDIREMTSEEVAAYEEKLRSIGYTEEQIKKIEELGQKAFDSAQDVKTFSQLMDTLKESVGSGWAQTFEIIFGDFEEAKRRWTAVNEEIGGLLQKSADARNALLKEAFGVPDRYFEQSASGWEKLSEKIEGAGIPVNDFIEKCKDIGDEMGLIDKSAIQTFDDFKNSLSSGWLSGEVVTKAIDGIVGSLGNTEAATKSAGHSFEDFQETVRQVWQDGTWSVGEERKQMFIDAGWEAEAMGRAVDKVLAGGTLTMEDYEAALGSLTDEQLRANGYTDEQIKKLREIQSEYGDLNGSVDGTAKAVEGVKSGADLLLGAIQNLWTGAKRIFKGIKSAFDAAFPPMTADRLYDILAALNDLTAKFNEWTAEHYTQIRRTFTGVFSAIGLGVDVIKEVAEFLKDLLAPSFGSATSKVLDFTAELGMNIKAFREWLKENNVVRNTLEAIYTFLSPIIELFKGLGSIVSDTFGKIVSAFRSSFETDKLEKTVSLTEKLSKFLESLKSSAKEAKESISNFFASLKQGVDGSTILSSLMNLWEALKELLINMSSMLGSLIGKLTGAFGDDGLGGLIGIIGSISFVGFISAIRKLVSSIKSPVSSFSKMFKDVSKILRGVKDSLSEWQTSLKASILLKLAVAVGILAGSLLLIASIDEDKLSSSLAAITVLFTDLMASMAIFSKFSGDIKRARQSSKMMLSLSLSILILAKALKEVSSLSWSEIGRGLTGLIGLMGSLVLAMKVLSSGEGKIAKGALSILAFAAAIRLITPAFQAMSNLDWEQIGKGLAAIGGVMIEFALGMRAMKGTTGGSASMLIAASALLVLLPVLAVLGHMDLNQISNSLIAVGGALLELSIALNLMKGTFGGSASLLVAASALLVLTPALAALGFLSTEQITSSLTIIGGALLEFAVALNVMKGTLGGSAALLVAAAAIDILTPALMLLGRLDLKQVGVALAALAGSFAVIGLAGLMLKPLIPSILGLSAALLVLGVAITAFGAGIALAGVGISAIVAAFGALITVGTAGATAIVASLAVIISGLASLIPEILVQIGKGLIAVCQVIEEGAPQIGSAIKAVVLNLIDVFITCVPQLAHGALELVSGVLKELVNYTPGIVSSLIQFVIGLINGLADNLPELVEAVINLVGQLFSSVISALQNMDSDVLQKAVGGIGFISVLMIAAAGLSSIAGAAMIGILEMGAVVAELAGLLAAFGALKQIPGLQWLVDEGGSFLESVGTAIGSFIGGIVGGVVSGFTSQLPQVGTDLSDFMSNAQSFIDGAKGIDSSVMDGVDTLTDTLLDLAGTNLVTTIIEALGGGNIGDFASTLTSFGQALVDYSAVVSGGSIDTDAITKSAEAGQALNDLQKNLPKTGGWLQQILGAEDMALFGEKIVAFAKSLADYDATIKDADLNTTAIAASVEAGTALAGLQSVLPKDGGWWQEIAGSQDIADFGGKIGAFGEAIVGYAALVSDFSYSEGGAVSGIYQCASDLSSLADLVNTNGSGSSLTSFGNSLSTFGSSFSTFYSNIGEVNTMLLSSVVFNLTSLMDSLTGVSTSFDSLSFDSISTSLTTFVESFPNLSTVATINSFNTSLSTFSTTMDTLKTSTSGLDTSSLTSFVTELQTLFTTLSGSSSVTIDLSAIESFSTSLSTLATSGLTEFAAEFQNGGSLLSGAVGSLIDAVITTFTSHLAEFSEQGRESVKRYGDGFKNTSAIRAAVTALVNAATSQLSSSNSKFNSAGLDAAKSFASGMQNGSAISSVRSAANALKNAATSQLSLYSSGYSQGANFGSGFVAGIRGYTSSASSAANAIGKAAVRALRSSIDAHSPSREAAESGDNFGIGFVSSILSWAAKATDAGEEVGLASLTGLRNVIKKVSETIDDNMDVQPTISPVVDLTGAQQAAATINDMFNRTFDMATVNAAAANAAVNVSRMGSMAMPIAGQTTIDPGATQPMNQYNTFNITSDDPNEVANEVSYILQKQVERRRSAWG